MPKKCMLIHESHYRNARGAFPDRQADEVLGLLAKPDISLAMSEEEVVGDTVWGIL